MRILITGGTGQLGRALLAALSEDDVVALGHAELDVTDHDAVVRALEATRPRLVIHAAAWTDTAGCEREPRRALEVNAAAAGLVAEACAASGASMVFVSTNEVFDGERREPYCEDDPPNPINEYGRSKLEGERRVQAALDRLYIVRTSWLYGPGRVSFPEKVLHAAAKGGPLKLVTDEIASPTWTGDLAGAIGQLIRQPAYGIYHFTNAGWCSRLEWAREVLRLAGLRHVAVQPTTLAEFDAPYRKPVFSALANNAGTRLGMTLRPWQEALSDHFLHPENAFAPASPGQMSNRWRAETL